MTLRNAVHPSRIKMHLSASTKEEALFELTELYCAADNRSDFDEITAAVMERELRQSTAAEHGIAVPHARIRSLDRVSITIGFSPQGIDFGAPDGGLTHIIVLLLSPMNDFSGHIRALAELAGFLGAPRRREFLMNAQTAEEVSEFFEGV